MSKFNNHLYNLFNQLVQEHKSLWRIEKYYLKDSRGCKKCLALWRKLKEDKENHIEEIQKIILNHK